MTTIVKKKKLKRGQANFEKESSTISEMKSTVNETRNYNKWDKQIRQG